jgi:hypothetical protein
MTSRRNIHGNYELPNGLLIARPFGRSKLWTIWRRDKWRIEQLDSAKSLRAAEEKAGRLSERKYDTAIK